MTSGYRSAGVDYDVLDAVKRRALGAALGSLAAPARRGATVERETIGEPAQLMEVHGVRVAVVLECLGTKSSVARDVEEGLGLDLWEGIGYDTVAAVLNDLSCVGALPVCVSAYFATGSAGWYSGTRQASLVSGWAAACEEAGAAWVGGESPTLPGIVDEASVDLAGAAVGIVPPQASPWLASRIQPGDVIVLLSSSGLHANGASVVRRVASRLEEGYATPLPSGRRLGEAALDRSILYTKLVEALQGPEQEHTGAAVHYATHITGHGLRKLMRAGRDLTYRVTSLPGVPEVLAFVAAEAGLGAREAHATFNMGAGFALFVASGAAGRVVELARRLGYEALEAGEVLEGPRQVLLEPLGVAYGSEELELR